jgi:hypothetical protein
MIYRQVHDMLFKPEAQAGGRYMQQLLSSAVTARNKTDEMNWLRHYATSRKVAGSIPDEVIGFFFSIYLILPAAPWPWS